MRVSREAVGAFLGAAEAKAAREASKRPAVDPSKLTVPRSPEECARAGMRENPDHRVWHRF